MKSIQRIDSNTRPKKKKQQTLAEQLGVTHFLSDLVQTRIVRKSKRRFVCGNCGLDRNMDKDGTPCPKCAHDHLVYEGEQIQKADNSHLPVGAERCAYKPTSNYNVVYIPVNRLRQVYQSDEALNPSKVKENRKKIQEGIPMDPVEIGYNYDVHDGHHRWEASKDEGLTHVPCKVVGTDPDKVREAIKKYKEVWKGEQPFDLMKGFLNTAKLIKRRVMVKGKNGKTFYRMQWVAPGDNNPALQHPGKDESTYAHHEDGIKDLEKRQSNRFPVVHHPVSGLKNTQQNYNTDKKAYDEADRAYKRGDKLPPIKINDKGEILDNHHLVDLARKHGLSHVPAIVMGNTQEKKKLEDKLKEDTLVEAEDESGKKTLVPAATIAGNGGDVGEHPDVETFKNFTSKKYTKQHIMNEARRHGIKWKEDTEKGELLPDHSQIAWMRAYQAIADFIRKGGKFEVGHDEKEVDKRMKQDGWDTIHKHFLKLLEKHGSKQNLMEWAKSNGITWKEKLDPSINWMYAATAIKKELSKGKMVDGVRTRQKDAMKEANLVITDQTKERVAGLGRKYGKKAMMERASMLGITWDNTSKGQILPESSPIVWMRASHAIQRHIAEGNDFTIGEDNYEENGINARVGEYGGVKLTNLQGVAVDLGKRNSQNYELKAKEWAMKALTADLGKEINHEELYRKFVDGARNSRLMLHFDPNHVLPSGVTMLEELTSEFAFKNGWQLGTVKDPEEMELMERELFGYDFDDAGKNDRPVYGVLDLLNHGLKSSPYGSVAFVMKDDVKKRSTGVHTDSANLGYETNGKLTRGLDDPHHLLVDRWSSKWSEPKNKDSKRSRMMKAVMDGTKGVDDNDYFEAHVLGGVDLKRDVDHILIPSDWKDNKDHKDTHDMMKSFAAFLGVDYKYE